MANSMPAVAYQIRSDARGGSLRFEFVSSSLKEQFGITRESMIQNADLISPCIFEEDRPAIAAAWEGSARNPRASLPRFSH